MEDPIPFPIELLPDDILRKIFCVLAEGVKIKIQKTKGCPWTFCRVSSRWRTIAIATPGLWGNINFDHDHHMYGRNSLYLAGICLERSRSYPLTVSFNIHKWRNPQTVELMLSSSPRWISAAFSAKTLRLLNPIKNRLPELQRLSIKHYEESYSDLSILFAVVPKLTHISLCCITAFFRKDSSVPLSFAQLKHLSLFPPINLSFLERISTHAKHCSSLLIGDEELPRRHYEEDDFRLSNFEGSTVEAHFPCVKILLIKGSGSPKLFESLRLPNLVDLYINAFDSQAMENAMRLFCRREYKFTPSVVTLTEDPSIISLLPSITNPNQFENLISLLLEIPSIEKLVIAFTDALARKMLLAYLAYFPPPNLLPRLRTLCLSQCGPDEMSTLVAFVTCSLGFEGIFRDHHGDPPTSLLKKSPDASPLQAVKFSYQYIGNNVEDKYLLQLERLAEEGLIELDTTWANDVQAGFEKFNVFSSL